ncbi:MAG: DUF485 domain-containing protein [Rhodocyclaceae bacterium]|nr:DUF485 domain-containing protein [Rhodocyclaceae bacterium]
MGDPAIDWAAINADPRFRELHRRKMRFLGFLVAASAIYYFMLPIGAAYFPEIFRVRVAGAVNAGLLFALSEFVFACGVAVLYARRAGRDFDRLAGALADEAAARTHAGAGRDA